MLIMNVTKPILILINSIWLSINKLINSRNNDTFKDKRHQICLSKHLIIEEVVLWHSCQEWT